MIGDHHISSFPSPRIQCPSSKIDRQANIFRSCEIRPAYPTLLPPASCWPFADICPAHDPSCHMTLMALSLSNQKQAHHIVDCSYQQGALRGLDPLKPIPDATPMVVCCTHEGYDMLPGISDQPPTFILPLYVQQQVSLCGVSLPHQNIGTTHHRDLPSPLPLPKIMIPRMPYVFVQYVMRWDKWKWGVSL